MNSSQERNCLSDTPCENVWCVTALTAVIETADWSRARDDVRRFIKPVDQPSLEQWSQEFFLAQCHKL